MAAATTHRHAARRDLNRGEGHVPGKTAQEHGCDRIRAQLRRTRGARSPRRISTSASATPLVASWFGSARPLVRLVIRLPRPRRRSIPLPSHRYALRKAPSAEPSPRLRCSLKPPGNRCRGFRRTCPRAPRWRGVRQRSLESFRPRRNPRPDPRLPRTLRLRLSTFARG